MILYNCGRMKSMNMGERLRRILEERKLRQTDLLEMVPDLDSKSLSAIIKRDSRFSEYALGIAKALEIPLEYLIFGVGNPTLKSSSGDVTNKAISQEKPPGFLSPEEISELVSLYAASSDRGRAFILETARSSVAELGIDSSGSPAQNQRKRRS